MTRSRVLLLVAVASLAVMLSLCLAFTIYVLWEDWRGDPARVSGHR